MENSLIEVKAESPLTLQDDTAEMLINQWVEEAKVAGVNDLTCSSYRAGARKFVGWLETNGVELTEAAMVDYRSFLEKNHTNQTAKKYFSLSKEFVGWLSARGYIPRNVAHGLRGIRLDTKAHQRDAASVAEVAATLATFDTSTLKGARDAAIFVLACHGLRTIEVVRLNTNSIEKRRNGEKTLKIWGKGRRSDSDFIILSPEGVRYIDAYLAALKKSRVSVVADEDGVPLFVSTSNENCGKRLQTQTVSRTIKRAFKAAGIDSPRIVAHSLRASNVTIALDNDISLDDVALNARHRSTATTEIYRRDSRALRNPTNKVVLAVIFSAFHKLKEEAQKHGQER